MIGNDFYPKMGDLSSPVFTCFFCDFISCNKKDYRRHLMTNKHKINENQYIGVKKPHTCLCGKTYKDYSGLWRHKKKCNICINYQNKTNNQVQLIETSGQTVDKELIMMLMKDNTEIKKMMMDILKNGINNTNCNNTNI